MILPKDPMALHVHQAFITGLDQPPRPRALRASGGPYCSIIDATKEREEIADIFGTYFTSSGTNFHDVVQLFLALADHGKYMWGNWVCQRCNKEWAHCFNPIRCDSCDIPLKYKEVSLRVGNYTAHCDHIARYPISIRYKTAKGYVIKTKYIWVVNDHKTCTVIPTKCARGYIHQVRIYCAMLEILHGIKIDAYYVTYFMRANLKRKVFGPFKFAPQRQKTKDWIFKAVKNFKVVTQYYKGNASLKDVVLARPCHSVADYKDYMSRSYGFKDCDCPMLAYCSKNNKATFNQLRRMGVPVRILEQGNVKRK